jgi:hypothetical protein
MRGRKSNVHNFGEISSGIPEILPRKFSEVTEKA